MNNIMKKNIVVIVIVMCVASGGLLGIEYYDQYHTKEAFYFQEDLLPIVVNEISVNDEVISKMGIEKNTKELIEMMEDLYNTYGINSYKESIAIKGYVASELDKDTRRDYAKSILKNIKAKEMGYFQESHSKNSEAYYGYTRKIKVYLRDKNQHKNNIQVAFKYNKDNETTEIVVAIPFYNDMF